METPSSGTIGSEARSSAARAKKPKISSSPITIQVPTRTSGTDWPPINSRKLTACPKIQPQMVLASGWSGNLLRRTRRGAPRFNRYSEQLSQDSGAEAERVDVRSRQNQIDEHDPEQKFQRNRQRSRAMSHRATAGGGNNSAAEQIQEIEVRDNHRASDQAPHGGCGRIEERQRRRSGRDQEQIRPLNR